MKKLFSLFIFSFVFSINLLAQENKIISINSDILRSSYEKLSEDAFSKLWEESVGQQLKLTVLDQVLKIQIQIGGGVVSFNELMMIPELSKKMDEGTFPMDRIFVKHVCQVEIGISGNIKTLLEAGVSFPYRVTYVESISKDEYKNHAGIRRKTFQFFKDYLMMMINRIDKSVLNFENSLIPTQLVLNTGEQFSVERFVLATVGLGSEGLEFSANNPILNVSGKANFQAMKFSKTFNHVRLTIQNYGKDNDYRITISRKKINTIEFLNMEFGFDVKTKKKLFNLLRLSLSLNLFKFNPTWNYYNFRHRQFFGNFDEIKSFSNVKRVYLLGEDNFLNHKPEDTTFFRTFQISGHSFTNDLNLFNFYRNSHQEKIENRYIDSDLNTRENIGVGSFNRIKSSFLSGQKMSLDISSDYTHHLLGDADKVDRSGLVLKFKDDDNHGISETRGWYLTYTRKILEEYYSGATSEFNFLLKNAGSDQFERYLEIHFDATAFQTIFKDRNSVESNVNELFNRIFEPKNSDSEYAKWRKDYVKVMLKRTINRIYTMNELLDLQFTTAARPKISLNRLKTPGQLPMRDIIFLLIATANAKENISILYTIKRIPERNSLLESRQAKTKYEFIYIGKNFKENLDKMNFYY